MIVHGVPVIEGGYLVTTNDYWETNNMQPSDSQKLDIQTVMIDPNLDCLKM